MGGVGIYNNPYGTLTLTNCVMSGNSITSQSASGGGIYNQGTLTLTNCTVSGNSATGNFAYGGGISNFDTLTLTNSIVSGNYASWGSANFYNNGTYTSSYSYISDIDPGFVCAPVFNNSGVLTNAAALDFHLKSSSWLINSGDNSVVSVGDDLDGNPRIYGDVVDLGAYEYQQSPSEQDAVSLVATTEKIPLTLLTVKLLYARRYITRRRAKRSPLPLLLPVKSLRSAAGDLSLIKESPLTLRPSAE